MRTRRSPTAFSYLPHLSASLTSQGPTCAEVDDGHGLQHGYFSLRRRRQARPRMSLQTQVEIHHALEFRRAVEEQPAQLLDLYLPRMPSPPPLIVYLHGGAWLLGKRTDHAERLRALASCGVAVASIDYRLAHQAPYPAQYEDVVTAMRWLNDNAQDLGHTPGELTLMGASAGAHLAALASLTYRDDHPKVTAFVGLFGNYDLSAAGDAIRPQQGLPIPAEIQEATLPRGFDRMPSPLALRALLAGTSPDRMDERTLRDLSPIFQVAADAPPSLLLHGTHDAVSSHVRSERFVAAAKAEGMTAELILVRDANHEGSEFDNVNVLKMIAAFVRRYAFSHPSQPRASQP